MMNGKTDHCNNISTSLEIIVTITVAYCFIDLMVVHIADGRKPWCSGLKLPTCKVGDRGLEPHSRLQVSKEQNVSCHSRQCHIIQLTILGRFSWPSLAYMFTNVA